MSFGIYTIKVKPQHYVSSKSGAAIENRTDAVKIAREAVWVPLRHQLRVLAAEPGSMIRMARFCGISPSTVHRYLCPKCEHNQQPPYSVGVMLAMYVRKHYVQKKPAATVKDRKTNATRAANAATRAADAAYAAAANAAYAAANS